MYILFFFRTPWTNLEGCVLAHDGVYVLDFLSRDAALMRALRHRESDSLSKFQSSANHVAD